MSARARAAGAALRRAAFRGPILRTLARLALAAGLGMSPALAQAPRPQPASVPTGVRVGASVAPDTVRVGDPFTVRLRVAAPPGTWVEFPSAIDSTAPVELLAAPTRVDAAGTPNAAPRAAGVDLTAEYRLAAWTTGPVRVPLDSATVRAGASVRRVPLPPVMVFVRSVLPADSTKRVPRPPRDPVPDLGWWWLRLAALAFALAALIALLIWLARRARRRRTAPADSDDAYDVAMRRFDELDRQRLVALGEGGRHVALAVDLLRAYLVARFPEAEPSQTGAELVARLADREEVPHEALRDVLATGDLVKFAALPLGADEAQRSAAAARGVVESTEAALRARAAREAAAAAERARAEQAARLAYERARRRSATDDQRQDRAA